MRLQERLLALPLERDHKRRARIAGPHQEQVRPSRRCPPISTTASPQSTSASTPARAPAARTPRRPGRPARAAGGGRTRARSSRRPRRPAPSTSRCQIRFAVCRCLRGASRSASSHASISGRYGPSLGAGRRSGCLARRRQRQPRAPAAPPADAHRGGAPARGSTTPPAPGPYGSARTAPPSIPSPLRPPARAPKSPNGRARHRTRVGPNQTVEVGPTQTVAPQVFRCGRCVRLRCHRPGAGWRWSVPSRTSSTSPVRGSYSDVDPAPC